MTFDLCGVPVQFGHDTYTLAGGTSVAQTPIVPPVKASANVGPFAGYFTEGTHGVLIFNSDGTPTGNAIGSAATVLYAHWVDLAVNGEPIVNGHGEGWEVRDGATLCLTNATDYVISGRSDLADFAIKVTKPGATLTLDNVTLYHTKLSPVEIDANGTVTLHLKGTNSLTATQSHCAGIRVCETSTLIIDRAEGEPAGSASLYVEGGELSAGIGGDATEKSGQIVIRGGYIEAVAGSDSAAIGGSHGGERFNRITVEGGTLVATGQGNGSDIGSGYNSTTGEVVITGGNVVATYGKIIPAPTNAVGQAVYEVMVPASGTLPLFEPTNFTYGTNDLVAVGGYLHLWLPDGIYYFFVDGHPYVASVADAAAMAVQRKSATVYNWLQLKDTLEDGVTNATLGCDITQDGDAATFSSDVSVTLDLNGHTLTAATGKRLFYLNSSDCELSITDSGAEATGRIVRTDTLSGDGGIAYVNSGHLILNGGTFTGKATGNGGAVAMLNGAFTMSSNAVIADCAAGESGGGLFLSANGTAGGGAATIDGGVITNCSARQGGGVAVFNGASVTMNDGAIVGNSVPSDSASAAAYGGGVFAYSGYDGLPSSFTFNGGRIANNAATTENSRTGGVVSWRRAVFTMNGGELVGCEGPLSGRVAYANDSTAYAYLNAGIFDDETVTNAENRVTLPAEHALAAFAGTEGTRYIVAKDAAFNSDGELVGGTFKFDPRSEPYQSAGLRVAENAAVVESGANYIVGKTEAVGDVRICRYEDKVLVSAADDLTKDVADQIKDEAITNLVIGTGVTSIGENTFSGWDTLMDVEIGAGVTNIGAGAFADCPNVTNITCLATAVTVSHDAFAGCNALETISFAAMPTWDEDPTLLSSHIYINEDGFPEVYAVPQVTIPGYHQVTKGSNDLKTWTDTTDETKKDYHFFKVVIEAE